MIQTKRRRLLSQILKEERKKKYYLSNQESLDFGEELLAPAKDATTLTSTKSQLIDSQPKKKRKSSYQKIIVCDNLPIIAHTIQKRGWSTL